MVRDGGLNLINIQGLSRAGRGRATNINNMSEVAQAAFADDDLGIVVVDHCDRFSTRLAKLEKPVVCAMCVEELRVVGKRRSCNQLRLDHRPSECQRGHEQKRSEQQPMDDEYPVWRANPGTKDILRCESNHSRPPHIPKQLNMKPRAILPPARVAHILHPLHLARLGRRHPLGHEHHIVRREAAELCK